MICLLLLVFTYFYSHCAAAVLHIDSSHDLTKGTSVDNLFDQVSVAKLFSDLSGIESISSYNLAHTLNTNTTHRINAVIRSKLRHFKWSELSFVLI